MPRRTDKGKSNQIELAEVNKKHKQYDYVKSKYLQPTNTVST